MSRLDFRVEMDAHHEHYRLQTAVQQSISVCVRVRESGRVCVCVRACVHVCLQVCLGACTGACLCVSDCVSVGEFPGPHCVDNLKLKDPTKKMHEFKKKMDDLFKKLNFKISNCHIKKQHATVTEGDTQIKLLFNDISQR